MVVPTPHIPQKQRVRILLTNDDGIHAPGLAVLESIAARLSDDVWARTLTRLDGLTDDEYLWEPAPGCWSIRQRRDGSWFAEGHYLAPEPVPFTTIAWRLWHLIDMYGEDRGPRFLGVPAQGTAIGPDDPDASPPASAASARSMLDRAHERWDAHLALVSEAQLAEPIGSVGGHYADHTRAAFVLHMLDEFVHHGAEVALLRDLWRWRAPISDDPLAERVVRGDRSAVDDVPDPSAAGDLLRTAADYGRWELLLELLGRGVPVPTTGRTPLHVAAGADQVEVVQRLLEHGADPSATDPDFQATPLGWAEFMRAKGTTAVLRSLDPEG